MSKRKPTKLTWFEPRKCWKKMVRGILIYLKGDGTNSPQSHAIALQELSDRLCDEYDIDDYIVVDADGEIVEPYHPQPTRPLRPGEISPGIILYKGESGPCLEGLRIAIDRHMSTIRAEVKAGQRSVGDAKKLIYFAKIFLSWVFKQGNSTIDIETVVDEYRQHILSRSDSAINKKHILQYAKRAIKEAYKRRDIAEMPRNIDDIVNIKVKKKLPQKLTDDELKTIVDACRKKKNKRHLLITLLALNCGMNQKDIAFLSPDEIDLKSGVINKLREKTEVIGSWILWDETKELLRELAKTTGDYAILNNDGGCLYKQSLKDDGKESKVDNISCNYKAIAKKAGAPQSFLLLRSTGASRIAAIASESESQQYLCHSPRSIAGIHYIAPDFSKLHVALRKWEKELINAGILKGEPEAEEVDPWDTVDEWIASQRAAEASQDTAEPI